MTKRVFITGATGYLGSHITRDLLNKGYQILCTYRNQSSFHRIEDIKDSLDFVCGPITDQVGEVICRFKPDIVVHTATVYESVKKLPEILDVNLLLPLKLLELTSLNAKPRWIVAGTALPEQLNMYSLTKNQFSQWGNLFSTHNAITFINLRLESFYGPNSPDHYFISSVIKKLRNNESIDLTSGTQHRDFVYIDDVVDIVNKCISLPVEGFIDIPVGTGDSPSIREVVLFLKNALRSRAELRWGAIPSRKNEPDKLCDTSKMSEFGLTCPTTWKEGMKRMLGVSD